MIDEVPVYVPISGEHLGAVVSIPDDATSDLGVLMMSGRARDRAHRNGMWVRTAEEIAERGAYAMRLDYPGVGNSTGEPAVFPLEKTPWRAVVDAAAFLTEQTPVERVLLVGTCFGARVMLDAAPHVPSCVGVAYICGPILARTPTLRSRVTKRIRRAVRAPKAAPTDMAAPANKAQQKREGNLAIEQRVSPAFAKSLTRTMGRVPLDLLFGDKDFVYDEFCFARDTLQPPEDRYTLTVVPGVLHTFQTLEDQAMIVRWVGDYVARSREAG